jgi:hypothetical protein
MTGLDGATAACEIYRQDVLRALTAGQKSGARVRRGRHIQALLDFEQAPLEDREAILEIGFGVFLRFEASLDGFHEAVEGL